VNAAGEPCPGPSKASTQAYAVPVATGKKSGEHLVLDALSPDTSRRPIFIAQEAMNDLKAAQALFRLNAGDSVLPA